MGRLDAKIALITGGARGIGLAFARRFIQEGAKVALADLDLQEAQKQAELIGSATAIAVKLDVTDRKSMDECVKMVLEKFGHIDILVNCAAIFDMAPVMKITTDSYEKVFAANVFGTLFMTQAVAEHMIARGKGGKIINMASQAGRRGAEWVAVYCASKAAVISVTQSTGLELIRHRINVNCIAPGFVDTQMWRQVDAQYGHYEHCAAGERTRRMAAKLPIGRISVPEDLSGMALFLASEDANYVVAQTYNVDGGWALN